MNSNSSTHTLYSHSTEGVRATFANDFESARSYYQPLLDFVRAADTGKAEGRILVDVGCGSGWTTYLFAEMGYTANGVDLNAAAFEPPWSERASFSVGDACKLPNETSSADIVVCYQCLEHVGDPGRALAEMDRVLRPGGIVVVVGPNLVSPIAGIRYAFSLPGLKTTKWLRVSNMPRHPYGNTLPECCGIAALRTMQLALKLLSRKAQYLMREPDTRPPFHADNDACYLCNPVDLDRCFSQLGYKIMHRGRPGRIPGSYLIAGGTWFAAQKPK